MTNTALIYCEAQFGKSDGKTANGLIRHSARYAITGVIDSTLAGKDAGEALGEKENGIPIFSNLNEALTNLADKPQYYIYGKATLESHISEKERGSILEAIQKGLNIVGGLHQPFAEDPEFLKASIKNNVKIIDVRTPPKLKKMCTYDGRISQVDIPVVAVLGTDCACGKRTTAIELNKSFNDRGIKSVLIATGQTSLLQGAKYGVAIDALPSQFVIGEVEDAVFQAFKNEHPDVIFVEGQGAVGHEAFLSSIGILRGSQPDAVILQHAPARESRCDFPGLAVPSVNSEIDLIESYSKTDVLAITLNHEKLSRREVYQISRKYEADLGIPAVDILQHGTERIIDALLEHFPEIQYSLSQKVTVPGLV